MWSPWPATPWTAAGNAREAVFEAFNLTSNVTLSNRIVMLPLTRARAEIDGTPNELMSEYYEQRAGAGLIISESTAVSPTGRAFLNGPGIYTHEHAVGWKRVVEAVHRAGGRIFLQVNHCGRANNLQYLPRPVDSIGPSAVPISRTSRNITINVPRITPYLTPKAIPTEEIPVVVGDFRRQPNSRRGPISTV